LSKWFQTRRFLWEFPIGYYVKLSSAVAAILVGGLDSNAGHNFGRGPPNDHFSSFGGEDFFKLFFLAIIFYFCNSDGGSWMTAGGLQSKF
jgi:hypothetical protein